MFWMFVYCVLSYMAVGITWAVVKRRLGKHKGARQALGIVLLLLPPLPYVAVYVQTAIYGTFMRADVRQALLDTGMSEGKVVRLRILFISPVYAQVLAEEPCSQGTEGTVLTLHWQSEHWKFADWDTTWSDCGSAEGNTFPPYPEAKEF